MPLHAARTLDRQSPIMPATSIYYYIRAGQSTV